MKQHSCVKIFVLIILIIIMFLGLIYLGLGYYYVDSFSFGTRINGIYCTGHSPEEINSLLTENYKYEGIKVGTENGSIEFVIPAKDIGFSYNYEEALDEFLRNQNPWLWPENLFKAKKHKLNPVVSIDEDMFETECEKHKCLRDDSPVGVNLKLQNGVYYLEDNSHHRIKEKLARQAIKDSILASESDIILDDSYFYDVSYNEEQKNIIKQYNEIESMLTSQITYVMGDEEILIDKATLTGFLLADDKGLAWGEDGLEWDESRLIEWIDTLGDRYDTYGKERNFITTDGEEITVSGGTYGNQLDRKAELKYLAEAVSDGRVERHEPEYIHRALYQGSDDIGNTYIEVDMTNQKLYFYVEGELELETPVVTGNMRRHMSTPAGTNYVYFKQKNRTLRGQDYATFVNYWIAVVGHIGIHDATWRKDFGGDIYKTNGSHGCINIPKDAASQLYDSVSIGTPVIMYYTDENVN